MAANMHTDTHAHQTKTRSQSCGTVQRSVISSVTPLLHCADRTVQIHTCEQMENSIRKPQGSNFTNAIFTLKG